MNKLIVSFAALLLFAVSAAAADMTVEELHERLEAGDAPFLIDVRETWERDDFNLGGMSIPVNQLPSRIGELNGHQDDEIVVYDRSSNRAGMAQNYLVASGFPNVKHLQGGLLRWVEVYGKNKVIPKPKPKESAAPAEPSPPEPEEPEPDDPEPPPAKVTAREFRGMQLMHRNFFSGGQGL